MISEGDSCARPPHRAFIFGGPIWCHTRVQELRNLYKCKWRLFPCVNGACPGPLEGAGVSTSR